MTALETLVNIGPQLAADLRFVGIDSAESLRDVGAQDAAQRLEDAGLRDCTPRPACASGCTRWHPLDAGVLGRHQHDAVFVGVKLVTGAERHPANVDRNVDVACSCLGALAWV
jgi:hypothetical protein